MEVRCKLEPKDPLVCVRKKCCNEKIKYASEFCKDSYQQFLSRHTYLIECGTGKGKSYMISKIIIPKAYWDKKKVLLLVNRAKLKDQYDKDMSNIVYEGLVNFNPCTHSLRNLYDHSLLIITYQNLESELANNLECTLKKLDKYDIIIADEIHYILKDATFNPSTRLSAETLLMYLAQKTRYFLSATMENLKPIIFRPNKIMKPIFTSEERYMDICYEKHNYEENVYNRAAIYYEYVMPQDYSYINVHYYRNEDVIIDYIANSSSSDKWLYFVSGKAKGREIADKINKKYIEVRGKDYGKIASFISAEYRNENEKEMQEVMDEITDKEDVNAKVIVTTSVLDNGINLKSKELLHVVINTDNKTSFIQMLGRKRLLTNEDKVNLYISANGINFFENRVKKIENTLDIINQVSHAEFDRYMTKNMLSKESSSNAFRTVAFFMTEYVNNTARAYYRISELSIHQLQLMYKNYQEIIEKLNNDENAFIYEQLSWIGLQYDETKWLCDTSREQKKVKVDYILSRYENRVLNEDEFEQMLEEIKPILRTVDSTIRSNRISIPKVNSALTELASQFVIDKERRYVHKKDDETC